MAEIWQAKWSKGAQIDGKAEMAGKGGKRWQNCGLAPNK